MSIMGRLLGHSRPTELDKRVEAKISEQTQKSEELSERVRKKLTVPPDALDQLIDLDRVEQELRHDVKELKVSNSKPLVVPAEIRKDLKEIKADVKEIKQEVKK